ATSLSLDRSTTASVSAEKSRPNSLTVSRCSDLAGSPSAPLAKLSRKLASASLTPIPKSPSDGVFAIVRWSIPTRLCRRSSSPWSVAAISASRACSHSRHHLSTSPSSFVVKCDFLGIGPPSTQYAQVRTASHRNFGGEGLARGLPPVPPSGSAVFARPGKQKKTDVTSLANLRRFQGIRKESCHIAPRLLSEELAARGFLNELPYAAKSVASMLR